MFIWFSTMTLMVEATRVIELRLRLIVLGRSTPDEIFLMVTEKIDAFEQAKSVIIGGGDPSLIIGNYRKVVAARPFDRSVHHCRRRGREGYVRKLVSAGVQLRK